MSTVEIVSLLSGIIVVSSGLYLVGLAVLIAVRPALAERFLRSFASSARAHYTEMGLRLVTGAAMINFAALMWFPGLFRGFGWILVVTTAGLLLMPWRWHHRFAGRTVPVAIRHIRWYAGAALALGLFVLYGTTRILSG